MHHTCTKHPFEGHQTLCTEISVWQLFCRKNFWKSGSQSNTCKLKSNWIFSIVLDYISMNNKKLVCFVHSEDWFKVHDLVHQFLNKCRRDACFPMVHTCAESLNSVLKKLCTRISDSFHPENYNSSDNNNSRMMNVYFHKGQGFPYWERWGSPPHQPKICLFLPPPGKIFRSRLPQPPNFYFPRKIQVPSLNNKF